MTLLAKLKTRAVCLSVIGGLLMLPAPATFSQTQVKDEDIEPKFIWGILIKIALDAVLPAVSKYMISKLTASFTQSSYVSMLLKSKDVEFAPVPSINVPPGFGTVENTVIGKPDKPLIGENGKENYQGLTISLAMFDKDGNPSSFRNIGADFASGERFKLRVMATFDAAVSIDAINPSGNRGALYPTGGNVALLKRGEEVLLPKEPDLFFEFTGQKGEEKLVVKVLERRNDGKPTSLAPVYRSDEGGNSFFAQETRSETAAAIVQSIKLNHN